MTTTGAVLVAGLILIIAINVVAVALFYIASKFDISLD